MPASLITPIYQRVAAAAPTVPGTPIAWLKTPIAGLNHTDQVTTWPDSSGNANDGTESGTTEYNSSSNTINSIPTVRFDTSVASRIDIAVNASAWTEATVGIVLKVSADPPGGGGNGLWTLSDADFNAHYPYTDGVIYDNAFTTVRKTVGNPAPALTDPHHYIVTSKANEWTAYLDGTQLFTTGTNTFDGRNGLQFGMSSTSGNVVLDAYVAEFIVYDSVLTGTDLTDLFAYFDSRFNL